MALGQGLVDEDVEGGSSSGGGAEENESEEERTAMEAMDKEKATYAAACGQLRDEKAAIEHIQKLMAAARTKLQVPLPGPRAQAATTPRRPAHSSSPLSLSLGGTLGGQATLHSRPPAPPPVRTGTHLAQAEFDEWYGQCLHAEARHAVRGTAAPPPAAEPTPAHRRGAAEAVPKATAPPSGLQLTGNKEADDDILAFQRAREELYVLQRQQAQHRT